MPKTVTLADIRILSIYIDALAMSGTIAYQVLDSTGNVIQQQQASFAPTAPSTVTADSTVVLRPPADFQVLTPTQQTVIQTLISGARTALLKLLA